MRTLLFAWMMAALLLFGIERLTRVGGELEISGFVNATEQEADEGYFAVGSDAMIVAKQDSGLQRWLKQHSGQRIRVALTTESATAH